MDTKAENGGPRPRRLSELAGILGGRLVGNADPMINRPNDLSAAVKGEISFVTSAKYLADLGRSAASAVLIPPGLAADRPAIEVGRPDLAFVTLLELFAPPLPHPAPGVHPSAVVESTLPPSVAVGAGAYVGPGAMIGENTVLYPNVYVGPQVTIGADCVLWPGVVIRERVRIGQRVIIHPNATIGADGFGYNFADGRHQKIPHIGTVVIEDDVEIGAGSCIDRAKAGATVIEAGVKIDNLVQIAHNVRIGRHAILVSQVGIAGSTTIGRYVVLAGKVGVGDHLTIGDNVKAIACSCIGKSFPPNTVLGGITAYEHREYLKNEALVRRLPKLVQRLDELSERVRELEQAIDDRKRS